MVIHFLVLVSKNFANKSYDLSPSNTNTVHPLKEGCDQNTSGSYYWFGQLFFKCGSVEETPLYMFLKKTSFKTKKWSSKMGQKVYKPQVLMARVRYMNYVINWTRKTLPFKSHLYIFVEFDKLNLILIRPFIHRVNINIIAKKVYLSRYTIIPTD